MIAIIIRNSSGAIISRLHTLCYSYIPIGKKKTKKNVIEYAFIIYFQRETIVIIIIPKKKKIIRTPKNETTKKRLLLLLLNTTTTTTIDTIIIIKKSFGTSIGKSYIIIIYCALYYY